ncbi:hypothetical protein [Gottfriedia luciferensis]|uniref:hypothetical protein n=1 Tax=Gottfriedia luciferensis TaxID=178774 RepID=UPI000B43DEA6|nr:hypothetical protein [Gottfriedia luciferensis]
MERTIEKSIDHALENFAPLFYVSSILIGIILVIIGILLFKSSKMKLRAARLVFIGIGIYAILSGFIQLS